MKKPSPLDPGPQNKTAGELKLAILVAAELIGDKKRGTAGGLVGYLEHLATNNEAAFATLLGKVLIVQVPGED